MMQGGGCGGMMGGGGGPNQMGIVKFFNDEKGFGFITPSDGSGDVFVHKNDINGQALNDGDQVQYDAIMNDRTGKPKAVNVRGGSGGAVMMGGKGGGGKKGGGGGKGRGGGCKGGNPGAPGSMPGVGGLGGLGGF